MDSKITSIEDLHLAIVHLKETEQQQAAALKERISSPSSIFATTMSLFPKSIATKESGFIGKDIFSMLAKVLLPLTLNKTLFRKSNFIVKALVTFTSQKLSRFVKEDTVIGLINKLAALFDKKPKPAAAVKVYTVLPERTQTTYPAI